MYKRAKIQIIRGFEGKQAKNYARKINAYQGVLNRFFGVKNR
jgi:hypothetical protein